MHGSRSRRGVGGGWLRFAHFERGPAPCRSVIELVTSAEGFSVGEPTSPTSFPRRRASKITRSLYFSDPRREPIRDHQVRVRSPRFAVAVKQGRGVAPLSSHQPGRPRRLWLACATWTCGRACAPSSRWIATRTGLSIDDVNVALQLLLHTRRVEMTSTNTWTSEEIR